MAGRTRVPKAASEPVAPEEKVSAKVPKKEVRKRPLELRGFAAAMKGKAEEGAKDGRRALSLLGMARMVLETASSRHRALWQECWGHPAKGRKPRSGKNTGRGRKRQPRSYFSWHLQNLPRKPWKKENY